MGWITKEQMWNYIVDPQTTKEQAFVLFDDFANYMFERGWQRHKRLRKGILSWEAQRMKEDFDDWYDKNIDKYPLKDLEEIQNIFYNHIPQTNNPHK